MLIDQNMLMLYYLIEKHKEIKDMFNNQMIEFLLFIFIKKKIMIVKIKKIKIKYYKEIEQKILIIFYKIK